tara:strand:- start:931 stop:1083 length:153 start_codon:yes stop_codon:yes gene_type:complete
MISLTRKGFVTIGKAGQEQKETAAKDAALLEVLFDELPFRIVVDIFCTHS